MMREFEIERQFNIKIEHIKPNKGVYFVKTNQGNKCLKKINYGVQKLLFVYAAKEHLINNGFKYVDKYCLNTEDSPYALVNEDIYTLSEWIDGRECSFYDTGDLVKASKTLAKMHECSKGYEPPENSKLKSDLGRWPHLIEKRIKALDKMRDMARKRSNKKDFDINYIKNVDFFKEQGIKSMNILKNSKYESLCAIAESEKGFCHHDYTYHNIIINDSDNVYVIDFDYCKREVRAYDISNFMIKVLKRSNWSMKTAELILDSYSSVSKLRDDEYGVIYAFLVFPQRFWRLANRYYYNEVNWGQNTFNNKMEELIEEREKYIKFIEEFKEVYNPQ